MKQSSLSNGFPLSSGTSKSKCRSKANRVKFYRVLNYTEKNSKGIHPSIHLSLDDPNVCLLCLPFLGQSRLATVVNMRDLDVARAYLKNLKAEIQVEVRNNPCRRKEWYKILKGDPVEIPPSYGNGYRVMTIDEWARDWKPNPDFKECAACGSTNTREHHFVQVRS